MTMQPARRTNSDFQYPTRDNAVEPTASAGDVVERRCATERNTRQRFDAVVEQRIAARLAAMPEASAELRRQIAECRQRRATDTCSGHCVITGLARPAL